MGKTILTLTAIAIFIVLLSACQATPDEPVVIQKDLEQMIEKATKEDDTQQDTSLAACLNAPEIYTTSFDGYNGGLSVNVNATVTVPDSDGISVVRIGRHEFTQEEADKMMEVFLQGATLYEVDQSLTKEEIQEKLVTYYGMRDGSIPMNMDGENPNDTEKLEQSIQMYEEMLADAPDTNVPIPADTKFHARGTDEIQSEIQVIEGTANVNEKRTYLFIENHTNRNRIEATFVNAKTQLDIGYSFSPYSYVKNGDLKEIQPPEIFTMTEIEAKNTAENVLEQLGITDMTCVEIGFAVMPDTVTDVMAADIILSPEQLETGKWAYSLKYQRSINGIPITLTSHDGTHVEEEGNVSAPWPYEKLEMIVDETGVVYFHYRSPYDIQETHTKDATLYQFSEIISIFEKMLPITYGYLDEEDTDYCLQVDIREVRLGLMRITEQNSRDTALLIPVWDFIGDVTITPYEGDPYPFSDNRSLITINAIDGTIIDRDLGY